MPRARGLHQSQHVDRSLEAERAATGDPAARPFLGAPDNRRARADRRTAQNVDRSLGILLRHKSDEPAFVRDMQRIKAVEFAGRSKLGADGDRRFVERNLQF